MSSNFIQFNPGSVNQESDAAYAADTLRSGGITTNAIIPSVLLNKVLYQASTYIDAQAAAFAAKGYTVQDTVLATLTGVMGNVLTRADIRTNLVSVAYSPSITLNATSNTKFQITLANGSPTYATILLANAQPGDIIFVNFLNVSGGNFAITFGSPFRVSSITNPYTVIGGNEYTTFQFLFTPDNLAILIAAPIVNVGP